MSCHMFDLGWDEQELGDRVAGEWEGMEAWELWELSVSSDSSDSYRYDKVFPPECGLGISC